jgi:hypothetical protein
MDEVPPPVPAAAPALHPALGPLAQLVGVWRGEGDGHYPTIAPFRYREEVTFAHDGRPVLRYAQRTWRLDTDTPMHVEAGYLRAPDAGSVELIVAQPTGLAEVAELVVDATSGRLILDGGRAAVARTRSAKAVLDVRRRFELEGDELRYDLWMTFGGHQDEHHLRAVLHRAQR